MCIIFTLCKFVSTCGCGYLYVYMYVHVYVIHGQQAVFCCLSEPVMEFGGVYWNQLVCLCNNTNTSFCLPV